MSDDTVRLQIRDKFLTHELPVEVPSKIWGGLATNRMCAVCDTEITTTVEIEAQSADGRTRFYHVDCYQLLCLERQSMGTATST